MFSSCAYNSNDQSGSDTTVESTVVPPSTYLLSPTTYLLRPIEEGKKASVSPTLLPTYLAKCITSLISEPYNLGHPI